MPRRRNLPIDRWLQRAAHVSQLLLVVIAVLTIYFTIIPLYRLAAMDEQVAKQEIELARTSRELSATYARLREQVAREAIYTAAASCTGIPESPDRGTTWEDLADQFEGIEVVEQPKPIDADSRATWEIILTFDVRGCLVKSLKDAEELTVLKASDLNLLIGRIETAMDRAEKDQSESYAQAKRFAVDAWRDESILPPPTGIERSFIFLFQKMTLPDSVRAERILDVRVRHSLFNIADQWNARTQESVLKLLEIPWPE